MFCLIADICPGGLDAAGILWVSHVLLSPRMQTIAASLSKLLHFKFSARHVRGEYVLLAGSGPVLDQSILALDVLDAGGQPVLVRTGSLDVYKRLKAM